MLKQNEDHASVNFTPINNFPEFLVQVRTERRLVGHVLAACYLAHITTAYSAVVLS